MKDVSGGWRREREERAGCHTFQALMHEAIDSGSLPEHCPRFKESVEGGRRGRSDGRRRGVVYTCMCKKRTEGGVTPEWRWTKLLVCERRVYLHLFLALFSSFFIPPHHSPTLRFHMWPTSAQLIYTQQIQTSISLCTPPPPGSLNTIKRLTDRVPRLRVNLCTHTGTCIYMKAHTQTCNTEQRKYNWGIQKCVQNRENIQWNKIS